MQRAGLSADEVVFTKTKSDYDDGILIYELEFVSGSTEYEAEINAADGTVIDWDTDYEPVGADYTSGIHHTENGRHHME